MLVKDMFKLLLIISFVFFTSCSNKRGFSASYYNDCKEYYDLQGFYHKDCEKNIVDYKEIKDSTKEFVESYFEKEEEKPKPNVW